MTRSVPRYLALSALLALIVNVVINAAAGWLLYRGDAVPLAGDASVTGDTIVGAFLILFFTALLVPGAARREVRSGRLTGVGPARPTWLSRWIARRRWLPALAAGTASALVLGGGASALILAAAADPMQTAPFLLFKIGFAGAVGAAAAAGLAALTIAAEEPPPVDDRWCRDPDAPTGGAVYPCDYVDKGGLAVTRADAGCSGTPTWQLVVRGALEPAAVRAAVADLLVRYPSLTTRVQSLDAIPDYARRFRYAHQPAFDVDAIFDLVDLRGAPAGALERLIRDRWNRHLDLFRDPPISLTMAVTGPASCRLLFRQHHAIADGRAFIELLGDFADFLALRQRGELPADEQLAPIHRRSEVDALELSRGRRLRYTVAGFGSLAASIASAILRPLTPLVQNDSNDYTGDNGAVRWVIDDATLDAWRPARKQIGASLGSVLTGALFLANQRWHRELGRPLGRCSASLVMETRPRDGSFRSFANHLATLEARLELGRDLDPGDAIRSIQRQLSDQRRRRRPIKRLLCERALVATMPLDAMQRLVFESVRPAFNLNLSNLIPLSFPTMAGDGWSVDEVLITTPVTPRTGIVLTVVRYAGRVCFNFNYASSAATAEQTAALAGHFRDVLAEITGVEPVELDTAALSSIQRARPAAREVA